MRIQFVPLPAIMPLQPSSLHIFPNALEMLILYSSRPTFCTWSKILRRSSGLTTVRETAPATPPAMKDATTACESHARSACRGTGSGCVGWLGAGMAGGIDLRGKDEGEGVEEGGGCGEGEDERELMSRWAVTLCEASFEQLVRSDSGCRAVGGFVGVVLKMSAFRALKV